MACSQLIERLDSLWFFTNLFSSTTQPMDHASNRTSEEEEPPKPTTPTEQSQQNGPPNAKFVTHLCPKCGDLAAELIEQKQQNEEPIIPIEEVEISKPIKKKERMKRRRRTKRKILGELHLGFDSTYYYNKDCGFGEFDEATSGHGMLRNHELKMPPLNDGIAMKEHLKSWAYAVACTVR